MIKRNRYIFENIIEVEEFLDGRYGGPGAKRVEKKKATKEQVERINQWNKEKRARHRLWKYFKPGRDWYITLTYKKEERPPNYKEVLKHMRKFHRVLLKEYEKQKVELRWIRNIENTPTNNWHIHMVITDLPEGNVLKILKKAWPYGKVKDVQQLYERGEMRDLAAYITKNERTKKENVKQGILDHKITEAHYSTSRNMPLPEPKRDKLKRWKKEVKPKKGYYIDKDTLYEGINGATGFPYRHYAMIKIKKRE